MPRPAEPIELTRFERVIDQQIVVLTDSTKIGVSISMNEEIGESARGDYLDDFKEYAKIILTKQGFVLPEVENGKQNNNKPDITIPRIDAKNTFRWPSLIHEMSHSLFMVFYRSSVDEDDDSSSKLLVEFYEKTEFNNRQDICFFTDDDQLKSWLTECWCDLMACMLIGPSLYFSQYIAFINAGNVIKTHPPVGFRLSLIQSIIRHRFSNGMLDMLRKNFMECEELIEILHPDNIVSEDKDQLIVIQNYFNTFFVDLFEKLTSVKGQEELNERLKLIKRFLLVDEKIVKTLRQRLNEGFPVPSIKIVNSQNEYEELPTYVQEIFLASWLSRCDSLRPRILKEITTTKDDKIAYCEIKRLIIRHNDAILKSIQVSEWFDLLNAEKQRPEIIQIFEKKRLPKIQNKTVLHDRAIKDLILSEQLEIIPIINLSQQVGTTSIDNRLGTCFEVFYPDQYGIIDFTDDKDNSRNLSKKIDVDIAEGITIMPGQFLLGHSMEYVKLPHYICGNLEGRSSFARLGIEIHMTAGFIDPGFQGVITFEIYNAGPITVKLYPGMRIGQLRFQRNKSPEKPYDEKDVKYKGLLEHNLSHQHKDIEVQLIKARRKPGEQRKMTETDNVTKPESKNS